MRILDSRCVPRAVATLALACGLMARGQAAGSNPELALTIDSGTRLLVIAPHPDDEALGAAGLMHRVKSAGGSVRVALITSGDAFPEGVMAAEHIRRPGPRDFRRYGSLRERETVAATAALGIDRAHVWFLGFPDEGLCPLASEYLSAKTRTFESPYTGRESPSAAEQVIRGVRYRGTDVRRELEDILAAYLPNVIVFPHADDDHPDHCATSIFVREALAVVATRHHAFAPRLLQYLVHYDRWPDLDENARTRLAAPSDRQNDQGTWWTLTLTPEEAAARRQMLETYSSQMLVIGRFIHAFSRPNELYFEGPGASPPECWCDETHVASMAPPSRPRRPPTHR
jgi:LmbE family N-acetylglucosaminyl deacetylase